MAVQPFGEKLGNQLRWVLQVGIDGNDRGATGMVEAGGQRDVLAEVARQANDLDRGVALAPGEQLGDRCIPAAVVDADDLVAFV